MKENKMIWFDLDGTLVDLYGVENWLESLQAESTRPYEVARPLVNMSSLARALHRAQANGWKIGIVSWVSKNGTVEYARQIANAKRKWLHTHLPSVEWDAIDILVYGSPKNHGREGILFDDEEGNRRDWGEGAYDVENIIPIIRGL